MGPAVRHERPGLVVTFPTSIDYGVALGQLRKVLRQHLHVGIHRQRDGVLLTGSVVMLTSVQLILPEGYMAKWREPDRMFSRSRFEVFREGYWYGQTQPAAPTWYIIALALSDIVGIVDWKIREFCLPIRGQNAPGRGIPFVSKSVTDSILITTYSKREVGNFLSALNIPTLTTTSNPHSSFGRSQDMRPQRCTHTTCLLSGVP
jgi:hypothetical protein